MGLHPWSLCGALRLLPAFQLADPTHEIVTVHLELKTPLTIGYNADDLDGKLITALGRSNIFTPADLLAANPGASSLLEAAGRSGTDSGGWPSIDELRGKFIFTVHKEGNVDSYA